jgi:predicted phage terminase large subunit-like protein
LNNNITKEQLLIAARRSLFKKSYYEFFKYFWDETSAEVLVDNWHIRVLCDELQKIAYAVKDRTPKDYDLVLNISPATSKSTICTVLFPIYCWIIDPTLMILSGSHGKELSLQHAVKSRSVINSPKFKELFPEITLQEDQNNKGSYNNKHKGNRTATSVGAGVIGRHYHLIIIDDPITATASDLETKTANEWMTQTLSTRKVNKGMTRTILVMQRINKDDPSEVMISKSSTKHICLPAELTADVSTGYEHYYKDGLFDSNRLNRKVLAQTKLELGSIGYAGQYLQNPVPVEGGILKKSWFKTKPVLASQLKELYMFVDSAYTDKTENDPTGIIIVGLLENKLVVVLAEQQWLEFPELIQHIRILNSKYKTRLIYVEPKATGKSIVQSLRKEGFNIVELESSTESKLTRVNSISNIVEAERVVLAEDVWNNLFIDECTTFPLGSHDDMLDCLTFAIKKFLIKSGKLNYKSVR